MPQPEPDRRLAGVGELAKRLGLGLLLLFGSRARTDASPRSDWDFGFLSQSPQDPLTISAELSRLVGCDRVDVVDLARAGGLLRFRAARDGALLHEGTPGAFDRFRMEAARFWYDAAPILRRGYEETLERLG